MGFGFNLLFIFVLLPFTIIFLITWLVFWKPIFGKIIGFIWLGIFGLAMLSGFIQWITSKKVLDKDDYYGEYIVNRDYFKGEQTDWQYDNFRFKITERDSIFFYVTNKEEILETYHGTIETTENYKSQRLIIKMEEPIHHIMSSNPTIYRSSWSFYLVFHSPKFNNMFFKKGKWKPINFE